jgi:hypothetical protein
MKRSGALWDCLLGACVPVPQSQCSGIVCFTDHTPPAALTGAPTKSITTNSPTTNKHQHAPPTGGAVDGSGADARAADKVVGEIRAAGGTAEPNYDSVENGDRIVQTAIDKFGRCVRA